MAGEWHTTTLQNAPLEIIDGDRGTNYPSQVEFSASGHCLFLNAGNVTTSGFNFSDCAFITSKKDALLRKGKLVRNDVVLTTRGTIGNSAYFDDSVPFDYIRINSGMVVLRARKPALQSRYLYLFIRSALFHSQVAALQTGSAQPQLPIRDINRIKIPIPPPDEQRAIAHILGTLDDKIELNRRMNETLEAMARTLFKSWFVDFDPVRAKVEGRAPDLPMEISDLFPARLVDSELGEIPEGWEAGMLGEVAENPRRGVQPDRIEPEIPYIALEHLPKRCIALSDWGTAEGLESNKFEFKTGEIWFGKLRPYFHKVGVAPVNGVCSTDIVVVTPRSNHWFGFVLGHISSTAFVEYTNAGSIGTKMPRTSWPEMARYSVAIPSDESVAKAFNGQILPIVERIVVSVHESRVLAALRDALLPKLVSGELRVKHAERIVEAAS
jgi:type I restriction enzyme, S subunit